MPHERSRSVVQERRSRPNIISRGDCRTRQETNHCSKANNYDSKNDNNGQQQGNLSQNFSNNVKNNYHNSRDRSYTRDRNDRRNSNATYFSSRNSYNQRRFSYLFLVTYKDIVIFLSKKINFNNLHKD